MGTSQRTGRRVDQWSPMVIRYNAIRLTSQQVDLAGGCRPRGWWSTPQMVDPAGGGRPRGCGWPLAVAGMRQ